MHARSMLSLGAAAFVVVGSLLACGGSRSPANPTPNPTPTPTTGTLTIKGSTSLTGLFLSPGGMSVGPPALLPGTPTSVRVKVLKVYLSANADCSSPVLVQDKAGAADYQGLTGTPTLFSGSVSAGSYGCVIMKVSDLMKFTPDAAAQNASSGVCVAGREYDFDILKVEDPAENWYDVDSGGTVPGAGTYGAPVPQDVFLFISTNAAAVTAANPRVHTHQLVPLGNPVVIRASQVTNAAFVFDFANRMAVTTDGKGGNYCWLENVAAQFVVQ